MGPEVLYRIEQSATTEDLKGAVRINPELPEELSLQEMIFLRRIAETRRQRDAAGCNIL